MLDKGIHVGLVGCTLLALAACSSAPATPQVEVTLMGTTETAFVSTDPLVYTHAHPGTFTTIRAGSDSGDYSLRLLIATPLRPDTYTHAETADPTAGTFNAELMICGEGPGCTGVASNRGGTLTITRADEVTSGELIADLEAFGGGDYGDAAATFIVPPA